MLRLIIFFIIVALLSYAALWFVDHPGEVVVQWLGYRLETNIIFVTTVVSAAFIVALILLETALFIKNLPKWISQRRAASRHSRVLLSLTRGFAAISVGDAKRATLAAKETFKLMNNQSAKNQLIAYILAAEAAQLEGDITKARQHYSALLEHKPTEFAAVKGLLDSNKQEGNLVYALKLAERAYELRPNAPGVVVALLTIYKQAGKWSEAQLFLEKHTSKKIFAIFSRDAGLDLRYEKAVIYHMRARKYFADGDMEKAFATAEIAVKEKSGFIPVVLLYCDLALRFNKKRKATSAIEQIWQDFPHPDLAEKYFLIHTTDSPKKKMKRAQKLLSLNQDHPESHRMFALNSLEQGDLTKARNHAKLAMAGGETIELCNLMAEIEKTAEDSDDQIGQQWSSRAKHAMLDPYWSCSTCANSYEQWDIKCTSCNAVDTIIWKSPIVDRKISDEEESDRQQLMITPNRPSA